VVAILSYSVIEGNAQSFEPLIDQDFCRVKASLYELGEALMNLMDDSQTLNDIQREYFAGKLDYSAVERARNELNKSQRKWLQKIVQYLLATIEFEPTIKYQTANLQYQNVDDLINYKNNLDDIQDKLYNPTHPNLPQQPVAV